MTTISVDTGSDDEGLSAEVCQKLVEDFVGITGTNEAVAQMFLQEINWDLGTAVNNFFEVTNGSDDSRALVTSSASASHTPIVDSIDDDPIEVIPVVKTPKRPALEVTLNDSDDDEKASSKKAPTKHRKELIFITYNIDGICEKNRDLRTEAVCKIIRDTKADIVFLQEVVESTAKIIKDKLELEYSIISGREFKGFLADYFTLSLFRKSTVQLNSHEIVDYKLSVMTRNMLTANVSVNGMKLNLVNTHMESTKDFKSHRIAQFEECFAFVQSCPIEEPVIIAGDLNMRDKELDDAGGLPPGLVDAWQVTGKKRECEFTWDMTRNDNLDGNFGKFKPRCRFDRILIRDSKPSKMIPSLFNLIGIERLKPHVCFPSDHWGILCIFNTFCLQK